MSKAWRGESQGTSGLWNTYWETDLHNQGASDWIFCGSYFGKGCSCIQTQLHLRLHSCGVVENKGPDKARCLTEHPKPSFKGSELDNCQTWLPFPF